MPRKISLQLLCAMSSILLATSATADFEDTVPSSFGDASVKPTVPVQPATTTPPAPNAQAPAQANHATTPNTQEPAPQ
jgi:hypothetical protein